MAASALSLSSAYKASVFSEINPVLPSLFTLKILSMEKSSDSQSYKKKIIDQILGYISFSIKSLAHLGNLFAKTPTINKVNG